MKTRFDSIGISSPDWLSEDDLVAMQMLLGKNGFLDPTEQILGLSRAGAGNMNLTLRVNTNQRSFILKQARPWVEKYPGIPAPVNRHEYEHRFYFFVQHYKCIQEKLPRLIGAIPSHYVLLIQDLGLSSDMTDLYSGEHPDTRSTAIAELTPWLAQLHNLPIAHSDREPFRNAELRKLNHQHLFQVPYMASPMLKLDSITPGLSILAAEIRENSRLLTNLTRFGNQYLSNGDCLLHGDFYPGSWLHTANGIRVIDPEFCFMGPPEFDLGVMLAHLRFAAPQTDPLDCVRDIYHRNSIRPIAWEQVCGWAAVETLRRLLGVAQLPLQLSLQQKSELVRSAVEQLCRSDNSCCDH